MNIDLSRLITNNEDYIVINSDIIISNDMLENSIIKRLESVNFDGNIVRLIDNNYELSGLLSGTMILPDDLTLEDVRYDFSIDILENINENDMENENNLKIINNSLDILEFLWQNILLEIPSKIRISEKKIKLEGDGWKVISEDEVINNNPFSELENIIDSEKGVK